MASANSIVTSMRSLVDAINLLLGTTLTNNWTVDSAPTGTTTGDAAWTTGDLSIQVNWTTETILLIHQSLSWLTPNNPGDEAGDSNHTSEAHFFGINLTNAEFWGFANDTATATDRYFYGIVEFNRDGRYIHFGFGHLEKLYGVWTGGAFKYGGEWSSVTSEVQLPWAPGHRLLLDSNTLGTPTPTTNSATMRASGIIDQPTNHDYLVFSESISLPSTNDANGNPLGRADGWSRNGPWQNALLHIRGNPNNAFIPFIPIQVNARTGGSTSVRRPLGRMRDVRICNIGNIQPKAVITLGADDYRFFPYSSKVTDPGAGIMASRNGGVAYRVV